MTSSSRFYKAQRAAFLWTTVTLVFLVARGARADTVISSTAGAYPASMASYSFQSMYPSYLSGFRGLAPYYYPSPYVIGYGAPNLKEAAGYAKDNVGQCVVAEKKHKDSEEAVEEQAGKSAQEPPPNFFLEHQARQAVIPSAVPLIPIAAPVRTVSIPQIPFSRGGGSLADLNALSRGILMTAPATINSLIPVGLPLLSGAPGLARQAFPGMMSGGGGGMMQQQQQQQQQVYGGSYATGMRPYYGMGGLGYHPSYYRQSAGKNAGNFPISNLFSEFARAIPSL